MKHRWLVVTFSLDPVTDQQNTADSFNLKVIGSQLISGGSGPNYQIRKSKLKSGMRELTAVLLLPTFLPTIRMNISTNWFKLTNPEQPIYHTGRMTEQDRCAQELRQSIAEAWNSHRYREDDMWVLRSKLAQLEAMLPMQSKVIQLPFENSASDFDLFPDRATALVAELTGYSGVDVIKIPPYSYRCGRARCHIFHDIPCRGRCTNPNSPEPVVDHN